MRYIYEKLCNNNELTDREVVDGMKAYKQAADSLIALGLAFNVAFKECNVVYLRLWGMAEARGLVV